MEEGQTEDGGENIMQEAAEHSVIYESLDPRVVHIWRISNIIGSLLMMIPVLIGGLGFYMGIPATRPWVLVVVLTSGVIAFYRVFIQPARYYKSWGFRLDDKVLEMKSGLLFRSLRLLPLSRLQHVDLRRGPLERWFGLASLAFHTAGTQHSTLILPGLAEKEALRLRDLLVAKGGDDGV